MVGSRLLWKLYAGYVALIAATAIVLGVLHGRQIEADARLETQHTLLSQAHLLRPLCVEVLEQGAVDAAFQDHITQLGRDAGVRITVAARDGVVLADSNEDPRAMENHRGRPEIAAAMQGRVGMSERSSATLQQRMLYVALPVEHDGEVVGSVRTARPESNLAEHAAAMRTNIAIAIAIVTAIGCLVGFFFVRHMTDRLLTMTSVATAMAAGDHHRRVAPMGDDEIGTLAGAFNAMAEQLENRIETIARERTELRAVLESMAEGVVAVDRNHRVVLINDAARRILGVTVDDANERPIWEVTRQAGVCEILDLVLRGTPMAREEIMLRGSTGDRHLELHATPLRDRASRVAGALVVIHDVTGLRQLEQVRRDFVTNVSHELKTPLTAIRGFVETLLDDPNADEGTRQRFLGKINDQSQRLSTLVSDLLTLARVESQELRTERRVLDLREPVRESIDLLAERAAEKGIALAPRLPDRALPVFGDSEMLRQVVDNLLDNAIKYTPRGGSVTVQAVQSGDLAILEVVDTGVGFEPRQRTRIFERFYRVDRARSRELGGTGLGLSIVKHVVLTHGGAVSADSTPGQGSTFRVEIPLSVGHEPSKATTNGHEPS